MYGPVHRLFQPADRLTSLRLFSLTTSGRLAEKAGGPAATRLRKDLKIALGLSQRGGPLANLLAPHGVVQAFAGQQFVVAAGFGHVAAFEHEDAVGV